MDERHRLLPHHLILEGRNRLSLSGIEDVESFDESGIICHTSKGILFVKGIDLHVDKLSLDGGELSVEGTVNSLVYEDTPESSGGGFLSRLFR
ncbi:MAG: sporulation protein YabP [Oscillospiraceae bacterium]|nr:sporulation protein YabP [Oscillospiraceae bacterium]